MTHWTTSDISQLSQYYVEGLTMKEIARLLNRTPSSLYKAVKRFNLHTLNAKRSIMMTDEEPKVRRRSSTSYLQKFFEKCFNEHWVKFDAVLEYLKKHHIFVESLESKNTDQSSLYALNNKIFTASQVLLVANRIRVEQNLNPFKVQDVSF